MKEGKERRAGHRDSCPATTRLQCAWSRGGVTEACNQTPRAEICRNCGVCPSKSSQSNKEHRRFVSHGIDGRSDRVCISPLFSGRPRPTQAVQSVRGRSGTVDNSRCNHVVIARERIAVRALAGSWSCFAHLIHHVTCVCAPLLRVLTQSKTPLTSASAGAHGAGAPIFCRQYRLP